MNVSWQNVSRDFEPDGALRDIYVSPATDVDWQRALDFLRQHSAKLNYSLDGQPSLVPVSAGDPLSAREHASPLLTFRFGGIHFAAHFFTADELEFDFAPNDIQGQSDLDTLLNFVRRLGDLLAKCVFITPENYREDPFIVYRPESHDFSYRPSALNGNA